MKNGALGAVFNNLVLSLNMLIVGGGFLKISKKEEGYGLVFLQ